MTSLHHCKASQLPPPLAPPLPPHPLPQPRATRVTLSPVRKPWVPGVLAHRKLREQPLSSFRRIVSTVKGEGEYIYIYIYSSSNAFLPSKLLVFFPLSFSPILFAVFISNFAPIMICSSQTPQIVRRTHLHFSYLLPTRMALPPPFSSSNPLVSFFVLLFWLPF